MTKIIVISAPRSGTHMLVRMISKSQFLPWFVPVPVKKISQIKESSWVIGLHDKYENVLQNCPQNTKIICIKRILGHEQSLNKINIKKNFLIDEIIVKRYRVVIGSLLLLIYLVASLLVFYKYIYNLSAI